MERYENLGLVGEGSYGMVMKCRHKETSQIVAIKKFIESEDDKMVKKIAMREIRMLKQLHHENLVNLLEVFRRKKRLFLVFEFVDKTVLDDLEKRPNGLDDHTAKRVTFQVLRGLEFCHHHNIIHRDVKPENILVSKSGIVKLCDFGFARTLAIGPGEVFTDYVATRWYRAPELLVGDTHYGKAVDIWAVGCLLSEMLTGEPLFPGDSDIDQLHHITKTLGDLTQRHKEIFQKNPLFMGMRLPEVLEITPLEKRYPRISQIAMDVIKQSLLLEASERPSCSQMMQHTYFTKDNFADKLINELRLKIEKETAENPLLRAIVARRDNLEEKSRRERERERKTRKDSKESAHKLIETKKKKDYLARKQSSSSLHQLEKVTSNQDTRQTYHELNTSRSSRRVSERNNQLSPQHEIKSENTQEELNNINNNRSPSWSDVKMSSRTALPMNVSSPSADLPELHSQQGYRGHDPKSKKIVTGYAKKSMANIDANTGTIYSTGERIYDQRTIVNSEKLDRRDELASSDRTTRKKGMKEKDGITIKRDSSDFELPHLHSGLTLPVVRGLEAKSVSKQYGIKGIPKKSYFSTMPHINTTDAFQNGSSAGDKELTFERGSKERDRDSKDQGNFPAV